MIHIAPEPSSILSPLPITSQRRHFQKLHENINLYSGSREGNSLNRANDTVPHSCSLVLVVHVSPDTINNSGHIKVQSREILAL